VNAKRLLADYLAFHESILFEIVETVRENLTGYSVDVLLEFVESTGTVFEQTVDDDRMPLFTDQRGCRRNRTPLFTRTPNFELFDTVLVRKLVHTRYSSASDLTVTDRK